MVFETILKHLPMSDNAKVAFGVSVMVAISYATVFSKGCCALPCVHYYVWRDGTDEPDARPECCRLIL